MPPLNVILVALGSAGDANPFIGLGRELRQRGHHVTIATSPWFAAEVAAAGLALAPLGSVEEFETLTKDADLWRGARGTRKVLEKALLTAIRPVYDLIAERYEPGRTVVAASSLALGARIAQDKLGVPTASVHLQPAIFRSVYETPRLPGPPVHRLPRPLKRLAFRAADLLVDGLVGRRVNRLRAELGLRPVRRLLQGWWHSPQLVLGLFPEWFASPQPDWPPQTRLVGFPLFDAMPDEALPPDAEAFLDVGERPIVFTPGSANRHAHRFFLAALQAAASLKRRVMLLTRFDEQVPTALPSNVTRFTYVPLSQLLPRCAAIVHHGGIGTLSQGFAAGIPQVLMPMGHDQLDNADRAVRLGVAAALPPAHFTADQLTAKLQHLLASSSVAEHCLRVRALTRSGGAIADAASQLEALTAAPVVPAPASSRY